MNKPLLIIMGVVIIVLGAIIIFYSTPETESKPVYYTGFTYYDIEKIQKTLANQNIFVSSPTAITDHTISQYCTFFDKGLPRTVEYCTTTAVTDIHGNTLGNINIGGDTNSPVLAIANLETQTLESNQDEVLAVIEAMIETLVCDCWEEEKADDDVESISAWVELVHTFYYDSNERGIKSQIDDLKTSEITLEITPKDNSVLQTLIILK
ncbi:hypothetical protein C5F49_03165 [Nitrosopumilus oxyclinae]|uniref:Uncharacterized protein n=1 Tax=Nitrosopumilus oxyclinae TaxID=1959104 RepID=A0A7D5RDS9_9ARCH|nr:hypothetical protein [Nitrosopumilus oxyclinae]QLH04425.1 hypothetical protein C5F49_03165 [Nitrosopumilus oxyclinae]